MLNRHIPDSKSNKTNFSIYKEANLKSKISHKHSQSQYPPKQIDFGTLISGPNTISNSKMSNFKRTEFVIPKDMEIREISDDGDNLSKYLKETHNVQNHTIHISDLMDPDLNRAYSKERKLSTTKKYMPKKIIKPIVSLPSFGHIKKQGIDDYKQ
jgi:hypothetical protein